MFIFSNKKKQPDTQLRLTVPELGLFSNVWRISFISTQQVLNGGLASPDYESSADTDTVIYSKMIIYIPKLQMPLRKQMCP